MAQYTQKAAQLEQEIQASTKRPQIANFEHRMSASSSGDENMCSPGGSPPSGQLLIVNPGVIERESSIYTSPSTKIPISAQLVEILQHESIAPIREAKEHKVAQLSGVDKVVFNARPHGSNWTIIGSDSTSMRQHCTLLDIVMWRVRVIPAFAHFDDVEALYNSIWSHHAHLHAADKDDIMLGNRACVCMSYLLVITCTARASGRC